MRISQRSIEEVRERAEIVEVASEFTALRRQGASYGGLCPYPDHQEKTPSFSVTPDKGFYYCFGCSRGGDAIKLVMDLQSLDFAEAVSHIAERSGIELEYEGGSQAEEERARRRRAAHKALAAATAYYHKFLRESPAAEHARNYLKQREISLSTIEEFRLGYAPGRGNPGFVGAARRLGLGREALEDAGLLGSRGGDRFAGRITFPISDRRGRILGFGARALGEDQPKYLNSPETRVFNKRELLYGFPQVLDGIRAERSALVVEGYTDVLVLYQSGIKNAVATLGTATTPDHLKTLSRYADKIFLLFDPDAAGERAIERAAEAAAQLKLDLQVVRLPQDPADWLLENRAEDFGGLLSQAASVFEYVFRRKAEKASGLDAAGRSQMLGEVREMLQKIEDPVFHRDAIRRAAQALDVSEQTLQQPRRNASRRARGADQPTMEDPLHEAGRAVLALTLASPELTSKPLREGLSVSSLESPLKLSEEDFGDEDHARIFSLLKAHAGEDLDAVLSDERARPRMDRIVALAAEGEKLHPSEAVVYQAWLRLSILSRQRAKRDTADYDRKGRLLEEVQTLKDVLNRMQP